jgi:hypothetical protein
VTSRLGTGKPLTFFYSVRSSSLALFAYNFWYFRSCFRVKSYSSIAVRCPKISRHFLSSLSTVSVCMMFYTFKDISIFRLQPKKQRTDSLGRNGVVGSAHCPAPQPTQLEGLAITQLYSSTNQRQKIMEGTTARVIPWRLSCS